MRQVAQLLTQKDYQVEKRIFYEDNYSIYGLDLAGKLDAILIWIKKNF